MWGIAVWTPAFTQFLHEYLIPLKADGNFSQQPELPIGDIIQAAIIKGLRVEAEPFPDGSYLDIGTPEDLVRAVKQFAV